MLKKVVLWKDLFQKCEMNPVEPNDDMSLKVILINLAFNRYWNFREKIRSY